MGRRTFMSWRCHINEENDTSLDGELQTIGLVPITSENGLGIEHVRRWITVARGNPEVIQELANELNRVRFSMYDLTPPLPSAKSHRKTTGVRK